MGWSAINYITWKNKGKWWPDAVQLEVFAELHLGPSNSSKFIIRFDIEAPVAMSPRLLTVINRLLLST